MSVIVCGSGCRCVHTYVSMCVYVHLLLLIVVTMLQCLAFLCDICLLFTVNED